MQVLALATAILLAAGSAHAQDRTAEIDKIFSWVKPGMPGCVAAASQDGKLVLHRAYGLADLERAVPLSTDSVFDAGSIRKQFVAAAILMLADEKRLALSDDVRKHIPELADYGHPITIDHLLTHTSGLRDWVPLLNFATGDPDAMSMILRQRSLNFAPGEEWAYSNSGYVLLPEIVKRTSGTTFAEFLQKRVFDPLGMKRSSYVDNPLLVIPNRALAYEKQGDRWRMEMLLENERGGAGALFTTAGDLVIWSDALAAGRLGAFVSAKIKEPATLKNGRKLTYARGLMLERNYAGPLVWHGGSAAAYKSVVGRFVDQNVSIAVLCNAGEAADGRTAFSGRILDVFMAEKGRRRPERGSPATIDGVSGVDVSSRAGLFFSERDGRALRLTAGNGRLVVAGGPALTTLAADRFRNPRGDTGFMSADEFELQFVSADRFELRSMEGAVTLYRRARPYAPSAEDLKTFAGRYESDELRATLHVSAADKGLTVRLNERPQVLPFVPVDPDTFQLANFLVRFQRNESGRVLSLELTSPAFRNVKFVRQASAVGGGR